MATSNNIPSRGILLNQTWITQDTIQAIETTESNFSSGGTDGIKAYIKSLGLSKFSTEIAG